MIIDAFLRFADTAKASERAKAAGAIGRAYLQSEMAPQQRQAAEMVMTFLLDDSSPNVRLALAEAIGWSEDAPRSLTLSLAGDQPEIACHAITCLPVLTDEDLVDLGARETAATRMIVAARSVGVRMVAAALTEVGQAGEMLCLLENEGAAISPTTMTRIADRYGANAEVRELLAEREDLPVEAYQLLSRHVGEALTGLALAQATLGLARLAEINREADDTAALSMADRVRMDELPGLIQHLRLSGRLTLLFLMQALCAGKIEFFTVAITDPSGYDERRVRSLMATGGMYALQALYEAAGLPREVRTLFVNVTLLWRKKTDVRQGAALMSVCTRLLHRFKHRPLGAAAELAPLIEKLQLSEKRAMARDYASGALLAAA